MVAHQYQYKDRQTPAYSTTGVRATHKNAPTIRVVPASAEYADELTALAGSAYGFTPDVARQWYPAKQFVARIRHYPEGQMIAVDSASGRVLGFTSAMRFDFDPSTPFLEDWGTSTEYG